MFSIRPFSFTSPHHYYTAIMCTIIIYVWERLKRTIFLLNECVIVWLQSGFYQSLEITCVSHVYISIRDIFYNDDIPTFVVYKPRLWLFLIRFVCVCGLIQSIREELLLLPSRKYNIIFYPTFLQNRYAYNNNMICYYNILKYENTKMFWDK